MKLKILILLLILLYPSFLFAEDKGISFFDCKKIVFFRDCKEEPKKSTDIPKKPEKMQKQSNQPSPQESIWAEPVVSPDGSIRYYVPPKTVLDFLENPTPENAKKYLEWNKERLKKINAAQGMLNKLSAQGGIVEQPKLKDIKEVTFFFSPTCPYSIRQGPIIEQLSREIGKIKVNAVAMNASSESLIDFKMKTGLDIPIKLDKGEGAANSITGWPTTVFRDSKGQEIKVEGYTPLESLREVVKTGIFQPPTPIDLGNESNAGNPNKGGKCQ